MVTVNGQQKSVSYGQGSTVTTVYEMLSKVQQLPVAKAKILLAWMACLYGFLGSAYLLTWHVAISLSHGAVFDLDSAYPGIFNYLAVIHASF